MNRNGRGMQLHRRMRDAKTPQARRRRGVRSIHAVLLLCGSLLAPPSSASAQEARDFTFTTPTGEELAISRFAGRPVLIALTDPYCGLTNQYPELQRLYDLYREDGLVVLGLPTDAFITRQSVDAREFARYCREMIGITFPLAGTIRVTGEGAHPLVAWLREQAGPDAVPRLPFYKYLIGRNGELLAWFPPSAGPTDAAVQAAVEQALGKAAPKVGGPPASTAPGEG